MDNEQNNQSTPKFSNSMVEKNNTNKEDKQYQSLIVQDTYKQNFSNENIFNKEYKGENDDER